MSLSASRRISIALALAVGEFDRGLQQAGASLGTFVRGADAKTRELRNQLALASGAALAGFGVATAAAMGFEHAMSAVEAVSGATGKTMERLRDQAIELGAATVYNAQEVAGAQAELAKAGVSTADILGGALKGTLDLAAAAGMDLSQAAEISANALNTFGLKGREVAHVADVLAAAANKSATDVPEMGMALKQAGLVADQLGVSIEETAAVLSMFAQAGLKGSDAGTSLRTMLLRMGNPTEKAREKMKELNLEFFDAQGNFVGMEQAAGQLNRELGRLTQEKRIEALGQIFGQDAIRAATILFEQGADGVAYWVKQVDDSGYAAEVAAKRLDNLKGDVEQLSGAFESLLIRSGKESVSVLRGLTQGATAAVDGFGELPQAFQSGMVLLTGFVGVVGTAVTGLGFLIPALKSAKAGMLAMGAVSQTVAAQMTMANFRRMAVGFTAVGVAAGALLMQMGNVKAKAKEMFNEFASKLDPPETMAGYAENINAMIGEYERLQTVARESTNLDMLGEFFHPFNEDTVLEASQATKEYEQAIRQARAEQAGLNEILGKSMDELGLTEQQVYDLADATGVDLVGAVQAAMNGEEAWGIQRLKAIGLAEQLTPALKGNYDTLHTGNPALQDAAAGWGDVADNTKDAGEQLDGYMTLIDSLFGVAFNEREALDNLMGDMFDLRELTQAVLEEGGNFDANTEAARAWRDAMIDVTTGRMPDLARAWGEAGKVGDEFRESLHRQTDDLITMAISMGIPEQAARDYFDAIYQIPEYKPTDVELVGIPEGLSAAERMQFALDHLAQGADGEVRIDTSGARGELSGLEEAFVRVGRTLAGTIGGWVSRPTVSLGQVLGSGNSVLGHAFADGGIEHHVAQIAPAGAMRLWAEPETGGESYIPHALAKRARSVDILAETADLFGLAVIDPKMFRAFAAGGLYTTTTSGAPIVPITAAEAAANGWGVMPDGSVNSGESIAHTIAGSQHHHEITTRTGRFGSSDTLVRQVDAASYANILGGSALGAGPTTVTVDGLSVSAPNYVGNRNELASWLRTEMVKMFAYDGPVQDAISNAVYKAQSRIDGRHR